MNDIQPCGTLDCRLRPMCARGCSPTQWEVRKNFKPDRLVCKGYVQKQKNGGKHAQS